MAAWGMTVGSWILMGVWILTLLAMLWLAIGGAPNRDTHERRASGDALDILRIRFARGEISGSEYQQARSRIEREQREPDVTAFSVGKHSS